LRTASGHEVLFISHAKLLAQLHAARATGAYERKLKQLASIELIVLDDFGLRPMRSPQDEDFHDLIAERYERSAIIVTSNLDIDEWGRPSPTSSSAPPPSIGCAMALIASSSTARPGANRGPCRKQRRRFGLRRAGTHPSLSRPRVSTSAANKPWGAAPDPALAVRQPPGMKNTSPTTAVGVCDLQGVKGLSRHKRQKAGIYSTVPWTPFRSPLTPFARRQKTA
jgi:hypothetical protein